MSFAFQEPPSFLEGGEFDTSGMLANLIMLLAISGEAIEVIAGKESHHNTETLEPAFVYRLLS